MLALETVILSHSKKLRVKTKGRELKLDAYRNKGCGFDPPPPQLYIVLTVKCSFGLKCVA